MRVKLKRVHPDAKIPTQALGDVGFDLHSIETLVIPPNHVLKVRTGLVLADIDSRVALHAHGLNVNTFGALFEPPKAGAPQEGPSLTVYPKIEGRSSLGAKGIFPIAGIIDPSYRGEMMVTLANLSGQDYYVNSGDRIAQLVMHACVTEPDLQFEETDEVVPTERGDKGFGSTGR